MRARRPRLYIVPYLGIISTMLMACVDGPIRATPTPTPDLQATVDAAVLATATAEAQEAARVATAVAATQTAVATPSGEETAPIPGSEAPATPAPQDISTEAYVTMSEEELAALIDEAVNAAVTETTAAAGTTESATGDDAITQEEYESIEVALAGSEEAIALAEELLYAYADLYAELATETLVMVEDLETLLTATTEMVVVITDILVDVDSALEQGEALSPQLIADLEAAAIAAGTQALALQQQAAAWPSAVEAELAQRAGAALAIQATTVAQTQREAIIDAYEYIEITREALSDRRLSATELTAIAQTGANATAGLQAQGGTQLQSLAEQLNQITTGIARGQIPQMSSQLQDLESVLPARPLRP